MIRSLLAAALITLAAPASAHEMFLQPQGFKAQPNESHVIALVNGTFDRSENTIDRSRMTDVTVFGNGEATKPSLDQWSEDRLTTYLTYKTGKPGTYAVGVSTRPRLFVMNRQAFTDYLDHSGVMDTLATFTAESPLESVRERYAKHVRTIVQVGERQTIDHRTVLGYPVEIILDDNPAQEDKGDTVGFQVLFNGKPLANHLVYASYDAYPAGKDGHDRALSMRTDEEGRASFELLDEGIWWITLIHMQKLEDDPRADYESNWATVTFSTE